MQRTAYVRGPAKVVHTNGATITTFSTQGDVQIVFDRQLFDINSSVRGRIDQRLAERRVEVTFNPIGEVNTQNLAVLFPLSGVATFAGTSVYGATDKTLAISGADGQQVVVQNVAVTRMPSIRQGATQTLLGPVTFTGLGQNDKAWSEADSLYSAGALAWAAPAIGTIPTEPVSITWGAAPWDVVETANGIVFDFNMQTEPVSTDRDGTIDMTYGNLEVTGRFQPVDKTIAQVLAKAALVQGLGAARGASIATGAADLVADSGSLVVTLNKGALQNPQFQWGLVTPRVPELTVVATNVGAAAALFTVGTP